MIRNHAGIFERYTERARQAVAFAEEEASSNGHEQASTEHLLLGLLDVEDGLASVVLRGLGVTPERVRARTRGDRHGEGLGAVDEMRFTPCAEMVLDLALREALSLGLNYVAPESILLALVRVRESSAAQILLGLDSDPEKVRNAVRAGLRKADATHAAALQDSPGWDSVLQELRGHYGLPAK